MRHFNDWLEAYVQYASFSEAPKRMHFWSGVAALAGALRRRVWLDMAYFKWMTNHYIVLVAPPGIVSKSTTAAIAMDILRQVPGINFGPAMVTWPALVTAFAAAAEGFPVGPGGKGPPTKDGDPSGQEYLTQCALTLESSEFGNLVNPQDREMIDLLITLWDAKQGAFKKVTKGSGVDEVENPYINMIACTTPAWIAGNFPEHVIGGGFTSRCLFVYAETKEKLVAYPSEVVPKSLLEEQKLLVEDLTHIATQLLGPYIMTPEAFAWGKEWYQHHYSTTAKANLDDRFSGYYARKQTHIHKLAMVLAASQRDALSIEVEDLQLADRMVTDLERDMHKVYEKIGRSEDSIQAERLVKYIDAKAGEIPYSEAYSYVYAHFPKMRDFEQVLGGAIKAGLLEVIAGPKGMMLRKSTRA